MSDKELDKLFKDAAEGYTAPFDADAWKAMESRLKRGAIKPRNTWVKRSLVIFSITVAVLGTVWLTGGLEFTSEEVAVKNELPVDEKKTGSVAERGSADNQILQNQEANTLTASPLNSDKTPKEKRITETAIQTRAQSDRTPPSKQENTTSTPMEMNLTFSAAVSTENYLAENASSKLTTATSVDSAVAVQEAIVMIQVDSANQVEKKKSSERKNVSGGWSIRISVSPDFSSIKFFTPYPSGYNYGVQVGYAFHEKWSASIGLINSKKIYASEDIESAYTTGGGYDYPITKLEGDCRVLDIPLNLYYTVLRKKSFSLRMGAGISSYLMKSEDYTYYLDKPYGDNIYTTSVEGENNEWFKIVNISLLVDKKINNRFAFELEPFVKTPLAGVGEGKVSLVTIGAFISLRYNLFVNP
jgi:hypothetical protein